jgi:hypothetical protein
MTHGKILWFLRTRLTRKQYKVVVNYPYILRRNYFITRVIPELRGHEGALFTLFV